jgi:hypothetical protein
MERLAALSRAAAANFVSRLSGDNGRLDCHDFVISQ